MDFAHRERDAYEIIYVLIQIQSLILFKGRMDRQDKIFQTSVTANRDTSFNLASGNNLELVVVDVNRYLQVGIPYLGILETGKERTVSVPVQMASAGLQSLDGYNKGLQR